MNRYSSIRAYLTALMALSMSISAHAQAQQQPTLKQLQFDIVGVRLVVDPPALTVPKNIPTQINTSLVTAPGAGASAKDALAALTAGAVIEAELRGPSIPPTRIVVPAGSPIPLPAFALPGDYFLDGIRLVKDGQPLLDATAPDGRAATLIPIRVISDVFVTSVTSRPLTLDEIREKGIVIDESSFQAVNFQAAFNIDGQPFTIELPAVMPTPQLLQTTSDRTALIRQVTQINQTLAATQTTLPPEFDRPGINFSIAALPFFFVPLDDADIPSLDIPPVTGLVVIAGNVAFLNQFFKVSVLVANVTPDGSRLNLRDVTGTVALPTGLDRVAGTTEAPGDDPLRLARVEGPGAQGTVPILLVGPDGVLGTADDQSVIPPQKQGEGELLLEGRKEGGYTFDVNIEAYLDGLPSGPVKLAGLAAGAVFVRNPTFSVTLAHPRTIRSGENYDLYATVTNTSRSVANLVSVNLDPLSISGAQLLSDPAVSFESIAAGESATAKFTLRAQQTGDVTFSSFTGDAATGGGIRLFTGVGERNVPLSPNAIVLPATTVALPAALVAAAQRVLGQAFSIATAPADGLPPDVLFVKRQTVINRGLELGQAGERVQFGEPLSRVIQDLLLDWLGGGMFDEGFDQLLRNTEAGAEFMNAMAAILGPEALTTGALNFQQSFAELGASRATAHVSAIAAGPAGGPRAALTVTRADSAVVALGDPGATTLPGAGALALSGGGSAASFAVLSQLQAQRHTVELTAPQAGAYDLGIVIPGSQPGILQQLRFSGIALGTGGIARLVIDLGAPSAPSLQIDTNGDGIVDSTLAPQTISITEAAPQVLAVRQLESSSRAAPGNPLDPATYGLILGVLLNKPVTTDFAESKSHYTIDSNEVVGARLQSSGRLVYLYLQKPIGGLTPRSLQITGLTDLRGHLLSAGSVPIQMALTDGGRVFGQVREAGGAPVPAAVLRLRIVSGPDESFDVSTIQVDQNGSFDFDFVPRLGQYFTLTAQHPSTRDLTSLSARVRGAGEQLLLNPTFTGRGTVRGRLLATDGVSVVANVPVAMIPGAVLGSRGFTAITNALGEFQFSDVPVGVFTLSGADGTGGFAQSPGLLPSAGQTVIQDLVLVAQPESAGRLGGRVFLSNGVSPASGFTVYVGRYDRQSASIAAYDSATTDGAGSFSFARALPPGPYDVVAVDPASQQIGVVMAASIAAGLTTSVSIVLEATGSVEGVVFNAQGQPVAGAVIAGGLSLGTADANGFFRITGVPAGARTIQAGDPVTKRRGSASVTVVPGQTVRVAITLEARATITGRVLDAAGQPMPRVSVRLPQGDGFTFVFTNNQGIYTFPDLPLGSYLIQAPGPSVDSLIDYMESHGIDPRSAFTTGDAPPELGSSGPLSSASTNAVLAAYQEAVQRFMAVDESLFGLPIATVGGFGFNRVQLFQDSTTVVADVKFLSQGQVGGRTEDSNGRPTGAVVRVLGLSVSLKGFPIVAELGRMNSDAASGAFLFAGIPRFDVATFQAAGVRAGDFTLDAAQPFSPAILSLRGQLNTATPDLTSLVMRFPSATETNGTVSGQVFLADGVTPANTGTRVEISFGDLTVQTGVDGRFQSLLPIPAGTYTITATAPNGLRGQAVARIPAGGNVDIQVRLLGLGNVSIVVRRPNGVPVANALVRLQRATYPGDRADGRTDGTGTVQFVNLTEGPVGIIAEEEGTGLMGRASGVVARASDVLIPLTITASGRVTGRFLSADGSQSVPFAQVTLSSGGVQGFTNTDADGRFELLAIPVGRFSVEASDPLTGRLGRATGELLFEGDSVDVTLLQLPRGAVAGLVVNADGTTAVPAARVRLTSNSIIRTDLQAMARADGSFRFDGVPEGTFGIEATDPVSGFAGRGSGRITSEGELLDIVIALDPFGSIRVAVQTFDGQPAGNATVTLSGPASRQAAVDATGSFTFEHLPIGQYSIVARSLSDAGDGGQIQASLATPNQLVDKVVRMRGTGTVTVRVVQSDGASPVASAQVTLIAKGGFAGESPGPVGGTFNGFTDGAGNVTFVNVPIGDFFARGEAAALAGVATGSVAAPGSTAAVTVQLGASGAVSGRVLLPGGTIPAAQAIVTLRFQSQTQLQSGILQVTTGIGGTFEFSGIPLGTFTVAAFEVVSSGVRNIAGSLTVNGQHAALGDIILDNAGPRVVSIDPPDGASGVAPDAGIAITFNEAIDPGSLQAGATGNLVLLNGDVAIDLSAPTFSPDKRTVTLRSTQPLISAAHYTVSIKGGPDGPKDEAAFPLADPFVSTFIVRDGTAPTLLSVSPAGEASGVLPEAVVRVTFSEPIATATAVLRDAGGAAVPAITSLTSGNTVLILSPQGFLQPNTSYTLTLANVADGAGNPLAGAATSRFFTVDTLAPVITALQLGGAARAGSPLSVQAIVAGSDTARVEFRTTEGLAVVSIAAPFQATFTLPVSLTSTTLSAVAVDTSGNRSSVFEQLITIQSNTAPSVTLTSLAGSAQVAQGQILTFQVHASDDAGLSQILFSAVGAATAASVQPVAGSMLDVTTTFNLQVPQNAPSGATITVQSAAIDASGLQTAATPIQLTVRDAVQPLVSVVAPVNNAVVVPGQTLDVIVDASDDVGLVSVALVCNPVATGCESRPLAPGTSSSRQVFSLTVPAGLQAPQTVTLSIVSADTSGNLGTAARVLQIADAVKPAVIDVQPVSGSTRVVAGSVVSIRASVTDNVGVTALLFSTDGAFVTSGSSPVAPPVSSGAAAFSLTLPAGLTNGSTLTVHVRARDAANNISDDSTLVLTVGDTSAPVVTFREPAEGAQVTPGQTLTVKVRASDDTAVSKVTLAASGVVTASDSRDIATPVTPVDVTFSLTVPTGTAAGQITLTASAVDATAASSVAVQRTVNVADVVAPQVRISSPAANAVIDPRQAIQVTVEATDAVGVNRIAFSATGVAAASETRAVAPAATSRTEVFTLAVTPLPVAGGTVTLGATARDAAGNETTAAGVQIRLQDVVAPDVASTQPVSGATAVDPATAVIVRFTEPMDPATLTGAAVQLRRGADLLAATLAIAAAGDSVTLTPQVTLPRNTLITIAVSTAVRDVAGNSLQAARSFTFTTASPDSTSPRLASTDPVQGAVDVSLVSPVTVTFSEAMNPATLSAQSFTVRIGATAVPGAITAIAGNTQARFTPTDPFPADAVVTTELTAAITDAFGNALAAADGSALMAPLSFTFTTARFSLTSPAGNQVLENTSVLLEARASATSGIASVVFSVNGQALPAVAAPFSRTFAVGSAAATPTLTIVASGRNGSGVEIARDQRTFTVVVGISVTPSLSGVPLGGTSLLRFSISSALTTDLPITLTAGNPAFISFPVNPVVLPAGQRFVDASVAGVATGATAVIGRSARGETAAIVAVSPLQPGTTFSSALASTGVAVANAPAGGYVAAAAGSTFTIPVALLRTAATADTAVSVVTTNSAVATAAARPIAAGQVTTLVDVTAVGDGIAMLIIRVGDEVRGIQVFIGPPAADVAPVLLAAPAGVAIANARAAGQVVTAAGGTTVVTITVLSSAAGVNTPVTVTSLNPGVATGTATTIAAGTTTSTITVTGVTDGTTTLIVRAGSELRGISVIVGPPAADATPVVLAPPAGVSVTNARSAGLAVASVAGQTVVIVPVLSSPAVVSTPVTVTSTNPGSAIGSSNSVAAGTLTARVTITGVSDGAATLIIRAGNEVRGLTVFVGTAALGTVPVLAPPAGVSLAASPTLGRLQVPTTSVRTIGIKLFNVPVTVDTAVTVTSSAPSVAAVSGSVIVRSGEQVANIDVTTGSSGVATLTIQTGSVRRELTVAVGMADDPAATAPILAAPVGTTVLPNPSIGRIFGTPGTVTVSTLGVPLLGAPVGNATPVVITSSNPSVALVGGAASTTVTIAAGDQSLQLPVGLSGAQGAALLTLEYNGTRRELLVVVGNPPASEIPAVTAPIVGVRIGG